MTKYFKLLGVALIAMSMALVSCDSTEENPTDDQQQDQNDNNGGNGGNEGGGNEGGGNTPDPNTPSVPTATAGTVAVTFGTDTWTAAEMLAGYLQEYNAVVLNAYSLVNENGQYEFPLMEITSYVPASLTGAINSGEFDVASQSYAGGELLNFYYYHETLLYVDQNQNGQVDQGESTFGDYWAKNATITVSALDLTNMTMTATGAAVMFEALPVLNGQVAIGASNRIGLSFNANAIDIQVAKGGVFPKTAKAENLSVARR